MKECLDVRRAVLYVGFAMVLFSLITAFVPH
jgi:hypothetical protein